MNTPRLWSSALCWMPLLFILLIASCSKCDSPSSPDAPDAPDTADASSLAQATASITNATPVDVTVYVAFGASSQMGPSAAWCPGSGLNCSFPLAKNTSLLVPVQGQHLNASISFGAPVTCDATKAEVDLNNPVWYDTADVSLVDGYNGSVRIDIVDQGASLSLGPPNGKNGNEKVFGLFPYGCDICIARQSPPCGIPTGKNGCKEGTQFAPTIPCQYQGKTMGGGISATIVWLGDLVPVAP